MEQETSSKGAIKFIQKFTLGLEIVVICILLVVIVVLWRKLFPVQTAEEEPSETLVWEEPVSETETQEPEPEPEPEPQTLMEMLGVTIPEHEIDWEAWFAKNADVYAWIYVPDTNVDYPVLQHPTDNDYYVEHNYDGSSGYPGCISTQVQYNSKDFLDSNTILYGHNMRNGSMFHTLHSFETRSFFEETKYAYVYLPDGTAYAYEIFAAYTFSNVLIPYAYDFTQESEYQRYLDDVFAVTNGFFREGMQVTTANHILTLSTCTSPSNHAYRYLVQAVMINDPTLTDEEQITTVYPDGVPVEEADIETEQPEETEAD